MVLRESHSDPVFLALLYSKVTFEISLAFEATVGITSDT